MKYKLELVHYLPTDLSPGFLYVSEEFGIAVHLCPCGCGSKIRTPLGKTDWVLKKTKMGPSLYPSIGNWQLPCQSHYWITEGTIVWAKRWTSEQIYEGHRREEERNNFYFNDQLKPQQKLIRYLQSLIKKLFIRKS